MPESAARFIPAKPTLRTARQASATCTGCDLYRHATRTVFGEGRADAAVVFVGEQPGDAEDVTNVVKHFKWEPRGKRRIHAKPRVSEVRACSARTDEERRHAMREFVADPRTLAKKLSG